MSNFKNSIKSSYTQVPNEIINNKELSLKAKGLLCYLISKPDGWNFSAENIATQNKEGLLAIKSALKELENLGLNIRKNGK